MKKLGDILLRLLDFDKAHDRVNWGFSREVLLPEGFDPGWVHRVASLVSAGQTAISINGEVGNYFHNGRGVTQGDPFSPLLFDYVVDALSAMLDSAKEQGRAHASAARAAAQGP